jgi:protein-disulfide isomerase
MRPLLSIVAAFTLLLTGCQPSESQSLREQPFSQERIIENLKLEIPQLRQAQDLTLSPPQSSTVDGFRKATLTVNGANRLPVLISEDGSQLLILSAEPVNVSRSLEEVTAVLDEESNATAEVLSQMAKRLPSRGPADAPVTLTVFSDFQCPYCARALPLIEDVEAAYPERVRLVFAHFPLPMHGWARPASVAAQCAARQSDTAFWHLHDAYFEQQGDVTEANVVDKAETILASAAFDALDMDRWRTCAMDEQSDAHQDAMATVDQALQTGEQVRVRGTPTFFINGALMRGPRTVEAFGARIEAEAQKATAAQ